MPGPPGARRSPRIPELQLADAAGSARADRLDVTLPAARRFARDLILEYLDLFGGRYWHAGADEYLLPGRLRALPAARALRPRPLRPARQRGGRLPRLHQLDRPPRARARADAARLARRALRRASGAAAARRGGGVVGRPRRPDPARAAGPRAPDPERRLVPHLLRGRRARRASAPSMRVAYESWRVNRFSGLAFDAPAARHAAAGPCHAARAASSARSCTCGTTIPTRESATPRPRAGIAPRLRVLAQKTWDSPARRRATTASCASAPWRRLASIGCPA